MTTNYCKDCIYFIEGYYTDSCHSPKNEISEITGKPKVRAITFARSDCRGKWFEPKVVDKSEEVKHNTFFQRIVLTLKAWKASKFR